MSKDALRRTGEIRTASLLSSQTNNDGSGIGQGHLRSDLRPATQRWALEVKKEKNAAKEALDATSFAKFFSGLGWGQAGAVLLVLGIPCNDCDRSKDCMDPGNQTQAPIGCAQTDDPTRLSVFT